MADPVRIDGYHGFSRLGAGGFATVYRAHQDRFDRVVAVKVLNQTLDAKAQRRFERECQATGRLSGHPNVVTVLDSGLTADGMAYMTTELMERGSLGDWIDQHGAMPLADVLQIGVKMCGALTDVHEAGILHRDLKPQNILVSKYGEPALADFGISAVGFADATGNTTSFTPQHTPPEVLEGKAPAVTMDVYSLGSTLYHLLRGTPAFDLGADEALLPFIMRVLNEQVPALPPEVAPFEVSAVLAKAMAKAPEDRFQSAEELGRSLQELQHFLGLPVTPMAATGPGAAGAETDGTIPSLLLPTFQPTLSPTVTGPGPTPATRSTGVIVAVAAVVVVALVALGLAVRRGGNAVDAGPAGAGGGPGTTAAPLLVNPAPPTPGGRLVVGLPADIDTIDPVRLTTAGGLAIGTTIYEPLLRHRGDGFDAVLAASVPTADPTFTTWTIPLRTGVTFHDGRPMDAATVKAAVDAYRSGPAGDNLQLVSAVDVADEHTVRVAMRQPWPAFLATLANMFVFSPGAAGHPAAGTGPFLVEGAFKASGVTVRRFAGYWGEKKPFLDEIEFRLLAREQERVNAFDRSDLDVVLTGNNGTIVHERTRAGAVVEPDALIDYLVLQTQLQPTIDPTIREAIGLAIDRSTMTAGDNALNQPTESFVPRSSPWYPADTGARAHDVERAKALVEAYRASHGGGPVTIDITTVANSDVADLFPALQNALNEVGITATFAAKGALDVTTTTIAGNFQAVLASTAVPADPDFLTIFFHSKGESKLNFNLSRYESPDVDAALDAARTSADPAARRAALATVTQLINGSGAYQFLVTTPYALIANTKVTGLSDALGDNLFRGGASPWCLALGVEH